MTPRTAGLRDASGLIAPAVAESLAKLDLPLEDRAVSKLAELYAKELDVASAIAAKAEAVLRAVNKTGDVELMEAVTALRNRLTAKATLENIGPKLLAALEALGATPKARAATGRVKVTPGGGKLAAIRSAR